MNCIAAVFLLAAAAATAQTPAAVPAEVVKFDFLGNDYLKDKIQNIAGHLPAPSFIIRIPGHDNVEYSAVNFRGPSGSGTALGQILIPAGQLLEYLDPTGDGYTIGCWVKTTSTPPSGYRQIFWGTSSSGEVVTGFKRKENFLSLNRYVGFVEPNTYWVLDSWNPQLFLTAGGWHKILMSVKHDMIRFKIYQPGETAQNGGWGPDGYGGHSELTYMGGQSLQTKVTQFGFGAIGTTLGITAMDDFVVYDRATSFKEMDQIYTSETSSTGKNARMASQQTIVEIVEQASPSVTVYPNPARREINVDVSGEQHGAVHVTVLNQSGMALLQKSFSGKRTTLDVSALPQGIYFVKVTGTDVYAVSKIFKN